MRVARVALPVLVFAALGPFGAPAFADPSGPPALATEKSSIKPAAERSLGATARPTIKKRAEAAARAERSGRLSMQIPAELRAVLEKKIERRIAWDLGEAKRLRREALGLLRRFVADSESSPELPEALMRLGELEWEEERDAFLADFERWEKAPSDQRGVPPNPKYPSARGRFARVLGEYEDAPDYDLALYVDGFLATEEGKFQESKDRFDRILAEFPHSRFVPDAHMVRAEFEFTKDAPNYETALGEYQQVLRYKSSDLYDIALFKSAWCLWRLGRSDEAARRFLAVFQATAERGEKLGARRRSDIDELQAEALKNLVAVFVEDEAHSADDMHRFLVKAGGEKFAGTVVKALAEAFYDQAHYERGIEAYKLMLKLEPASPEAYRWALLVAQGHSTMEAWKDLENDYAWLVRDFTSPLVSKGRPVQQPSAWVRTQRPLNVMDSERAIEKQLRQDAVGLHSKAQADKTSESQYRAAARLYAVYLRRFAKQPEAYDVHFNRAEILFYHLGEDAEAADEYLAAVEMKPKGEASRDALYNALAALERARATEFEKRRAAGRKQEETATDKKLTRAMELYVATYPNDPVVPELLFRQGKLYYDYEVFDPAVRQWGLLLEKFPSSRFAVGAGELILDSFNKSEDFGNIETWARRLKSAPAFQKSEQQARLDGLIVQSVFKQGEQLGVRGEHAASAAAYLRAAREFPKEPRAAQAAVNAEIEAKKAADLKTLVEAAALLIRDHKQQPEAASGLWIAATTHQSIGLFSEAARYHDQIVDAFPKFEHHKDAAYNAVLLRAAIGEHDLAIQSGEKYKKYYPRDDEADDVVFLMGKAHEKAARWQDAERLYSRYAGQSAGPATRIEALVRLASVRVQLRDEKGAATALDRAVKAGKLRKGQLDADGKYWAAKARYLQGERALAEFEAVKVEGDVALLKTRLKKKGELLKKAAEVFLDTAEMGVAEWTTAALYQIGYTYEAFTKSLLTSPPPDSLSAEEKELYKQQIEEFIVPIEENALEAYESGWKKAVELGIFNAWTAKMREALGRLNSELYPPLREIGFEIRSRGPMPLPALIDGPRRSKEGRSEAYLVPVPSRASDDKPAKPEGGAKAGEAGKGPDAAKGSEAGAKPEPAAKPAEPKR